MMEMNNRLRTDLMSGQQYATDGAEAGSLVAEEAKDPCNDTDMAPHAATEAIDGANVTECYTSVNVIDEVLDKTESKCSADGLTNNTELQLERHVKDVMDATKPRSCSETQLNEASDHAEFEPCNRVSAKEVLSGAELSRFDENHKTEVSEEHNEISEEHCLKNLAKEAQKDAEVEPKGIVNGSEMDPYKENHATQMFDNGNLDLLSDGGEVKEAQSELGLETCHNDQAKDPTNDDMHSEVSNPKLSPKQVTSSLTISSQPLDVVGSERGGCGEITSAYSWDSFADGTFCEEHSKCKLESASTACVVLEIPKHVRPSGIRKITFRFSKRKEDYGTDLSVSVKKLADDKFNEDFYDNQCSVAAAENLANNGFHNQEWTDVENAKLNSSIDGRECHDTGSPSSCVPNMELKMSKKIIPDSYPTNVKKLLSTGILEGARVKYISMSGERELPGIIKGCGYLCGCYTCNFSNMVSAYEFESHAGSKTRHPNNYIYLENGKPIYSIIEELRAAPLSMLDSVIRAVAGSSVNEEYFQSWKASLQHGHDVAYVDSDYQSKHFGMYQSTTSYGRHSTEGSHYPNPYQYSYMAPFSQQGYIDLPLEQKRPIKRAKHNFSSSFWEQKRSTEGGNKKRDNDLHKLLFMPNGLPDGTSLAYYSKGKKILGGYKQGNGIFCSCCNFEISPSQFEAHAGWAAKRQPYRNIYTSSGLTLHDIALMLANGQHIPSSGSDDMCAVCGDGGELIICNGCPQAYHAGCLGLQCSPSNDWHCPYCRDKFGPGRKAAGESRPIIIRLKRVVKAPEFEPGGCVMCRSQDFSAVKFDDRTVIICDQCEKEYHVGCLRECGLCDLKELPEDRWFCSDDCSKIFEALQNLAGSGPEMIPALVSAAIYKKQASIGLIDRSMNDIQWCILSGKSRFPEHLLLLSRAAAIFRECFDPIVAKSGRDIIPVMVYGRNISGQEFGGMYCVVLLVKSVVVSAALLRIFGKEVAELPLVATERVNQGKGYFQALFSCIESYLSSLSVKHLVLPAAVDAEPMWTNKLGFRKTSNEQMLKYTRDFQLTIFKGTSLLEKEVNGSRQF